MRTLMLTFLSVGLTCVVLGHAYIQKKQFYPSVVYITKSNPSMAVLYIQAFVIVILMGKFFRKLFFGSLRPAEVEHLIERSWYAVTETCLAFTVFRDDFNPKFVAMFTFLLFLKTFHWLGEDRVDYMERSPVISLTFHLRMLGLIVNLAMADIYFVYGAYHSTLIKGASVQLVFGFEYAILFIAIATTLVKYILHSIDVYSENPWDNKAVYLLYTELIMGFFKVMLYILFTLIMIKVHTFPLFAIRPLYLAMRNFKKALHDVIMSRRAIHNMNTLYPDATADELQDSDNVCIICREEMVTGCKKLPCNHIFHATCLRSWFQRQQTCPTCRMDVLKDPPRTRPTAAQEQNQQPQQQQQQHQQQPPQQQGQQQQPSATTPPPTTQSQGQPLPNLAFLNLSGLLPPNLPTSVPHIGGFPGPMPFIPPPFQVPFPGSGEDLRGLSEEELQELEGVERRNVEARIQCLRDIQTLLDAAVLQMEQYSKITQVAPGSFKSKRGESTSATIDVATTSKDSAAAGPSGVGTSSNHVGVVEETGGEEEEDESEIGADELRRRRVNRLTQPPV